MDEQTVQQPNAATNNGELNAVKVMEVDTSMNPSMLHEGFSMPSHKHQTNATSVAAATAAVAGQIIKASSNPLMLCRVLDQLGDGHCPKARIHCHPNGARRSKNL